MATLRIRQARSMRRDLRGHHNRMIPYHIDVYGCADLTQPPTGRAAKMRRTNPTATHLNARVQADKTNPTPRAARRNSHVGNDIGRRRFSAKRTQRKIGSAASQTAVNAKDPPNEPAAGPSCENAPNEPNRRRTELRKRAERTQPPPDRAARNSRQRTQPAKDSVARSPVPEKRSDDARFLRNEPMAALSKFRTRAERTQCPSECDVRTRRTNPDTNFAQFRRLTR
jgi:hypothetical protein